MDIIGVIGATGSIVSILSIFFKVPDNEKISIPFKAAVLVVSLIILGVYIIGNGLEIGQKPDDIPVSTEETSDVLPDDTPNEVDNAAILRVDPIAPYKYEVPSIATTELDIEATEIFSFRGEIYSDEQQDDYEFSPQISGTHRFEFSDVANGIDFRLTIYNSGWEKIKSDYDLDNGCGLTVSLSKGEVYYLRVEQYKGIGSYTLNVCPKKEIKDISNYTAISDSMQYTDQENDYSFLPENNGVYRFELSNVPNGADLQMALYNSGWERIKSDYDLDNGEGLTVSLEKGEAYYLRIGQYRSTGGYTLTVGNQKELLDISSYTAISDSIQYTNQENDYFFHPKYSGTYRFELSDVPDGTDASLVLYNSGWERIKSDYDLDDGDGLTVSLSKEEDYFLSVIQYRNYGAYTLNVGHKKGISDISNVSGVMDRIQYTDQENDYSFVPKEGGDYQLSFRDIPDGVTMHLKVFNSGWEEISSGYNLDSEDTVSTTLLSGKKYFVRVLCDGNDASYTLDVSQST